MGTNARLETTTNDSGFYSFANLPQGTYQIVVTQNGFKRKIVTSANVGAESIARYDVARGSVKFLLKSRSTDRKGLHSKQKRQTSAATLRHEK
jgi:hypothetical protein